MADPTSLQRPPAGERIDPTAIDATDSTLDDVFTSVSDGSGGKRGGWVSPSGGGGGGVTSFNARTGAVTPAAGDYAIADISGLASVAANLILAGPTSGGSAAAAMRALVAADIPSLDAAKVTSGVFAIGRLATGTPDGTKFVRDDGTLATPPGSGTTVPAVPSDWATTDYVLGIVGGVPAWRAAGTTVLATGFGNSFGNDFGGP